MNGFWPSILISSTLYKSRIAGVYSSDIEWTPVDFEQLNETLPEVLETCSSWALTNTGIKTMMSKALKKLRGIFTKEVEVVVPVQQQEKKKPLRRSVVMDTRSANEILMASQSQRESQAASSQRGFRGASQRDGPAAAKPKAKKKKIL
jgi:hypothetical protein